ncbi:hypothetical protein AGR8A_pAt20038 [Agrobacterium fabrum str. J-07]|nr:hypothetical protein AGR8A_pAt20038 [Agrobacterium fabrum str. J-07]
MVVTCHSAPEVTRGLADAHDRLGLQPRLLDWDVYWRRWTGHGVEDALSFPDGILLSTLIHHRRRANEVHKRSARDVQG